MDPPPPSGLNPELLSIWTGWKQLKDREVVREAAAKGLHISLAQNFIALRKQWDLDEAKKWFKAEVRVCLIIFRVYKSNSKIFELLPIYCRYDTPEK